MFDQRHYVPVVRWKVGEKGALKRLGLEDKSQVTPLIEWSLPSEVAGVGEDDATADSIGDLGRDVFLNWGARPFFWDPHVLLRAHLGGDTNELKRLIVGLQHGP